MGRARIDAWETVAIVAKHVYAKQGLAVSAYRIAESLDKLARIGRTLHRLYEWQCNEPIEVCDACGSVAGRKHVPSQCFYARLERLEERAEEIGRSLGLCVSHQRDPRGPALRVWAEREDEGSILGVFS